MQIVQVSATASGSDLFRDRFAGGWILSEAERMQELMNHDDLGGRAILHKPMSELQAADANDPRAGLCKRQRGARAALRRCAVIDEPQESEGVGDQPVIGSFDAGRRLETGAMLGPYRIGGLIGAGDSLRSAA